MLPITTPLLAEVFWSPLQQIATCRDGPSGKAGCRMCMGQMVRLLTTGLLQLKTAKSPADALHSSNRYIEEVLHGYHVVPYKPMQYYAVLPEHFDKPVRLPVSEDDFLRNPLHMVDYKRVNVWELHRPSLEDTAVVAFSPALSAMVQCNTAVYMLGSAVQAMGGVGYMSKYMAKDDIVLWTSVSVIHEAR